MKRLLLLLISILSISAIFSSCDPPEALAEHDGVWWVKNTTDKNITFIFDASSLINNSFSITSGDSACVHYLDLNVLRGTITFDQLWKYVTDEKNTACVYDDNGNLLKKWVWEYTEKKEKFFDESYWQFHEEHIYVRKNIYEIDRQWVFILTPEDIAK